MQITLIIGLNKALGFAKWSNLKTSSPFFLSYLAFKSFEELDLNDKYFLHSYFLLLM